MSKCFWYDDGYCCFRLSVAFIDPDDYFYPERYSHGLCPCGNDPDAENCLYADRIEEYEKLRDEFC